MSTPRGTGAADEPYHCGDIHVIWRTEKQRKKRWAKANKWMQDGKVPTDLPKWAVVILNHGGGGGP